MSRAKWFRVPNGTHTNGQFALERHLRDQPERAVAARDAERPGAGATRDLLRIVARPEDVNTDRAPLGFGPQFFGVRPPVAGPGVHDQ